ncbi:MAG: STAS domain-containing protein [Bacteroidota bacterium]|jgi:anti-sigma B factor antagonist
MSYQIIKEESYVVVNLTADRLDTLIAPSLKSEFVVLNNDGVKNIIINLESANYCDSSGLSSILVANRLCNGSEGKLVICNLNQPVQNIISISKLDSVLSIAPTLDDAKNLIQN